MSVNVIKSVVETVKDKFGDEFQTSIKPMSDFALQIAQNVGGDPLICMITSLLHRYAHGKTGEFRANLANSVMRELGFDSKTINRVNTAINNLLPGTFDKQETLDEKIVGDAYLLTYWDKLQTYENVKFNFEISEELFHCVEK